MYPSPEGAEERARRNDDAVLEQTFGELPPSPPSTSTHRYIPARLAATRRPFASSTGSNASRFAR